MGAALDGIRAIVPDTDRINESWDGGALNGLQHDQAMWRLPAYIRD
jgi:hypothetical protein